MQTNYDGHDLLDVDDIDSAAAGSHERVEEKQKPSYRDAKRKAYRAALKEKQTTGVPQNFNKFVQSELKKIRGTDVDARRRQTRDIALFFQYYDGNPNGTINDAGEFESDVISEQDLTYSIPLTAPHVDSGKTLLLKTQIEYEYDAIDQGSTLDKAVARMCAELAEDDISRIFTEDKRIREIIYLLTAGKTYRRHYHAPDEIEPNRATVSIYKKVDSESGVSVIALTEEEIDLPENQLHIPHPLAVQHELSAFDIAQSDFVVERDGIARSKAEYLYQQIIPAGGEGLTDDVRVVRNMERAVVRQSHHDSQAETALRNIDQARDSEVLREFVWLAPYRYANFIFNEEGWYLDETDGLIFCGEDCTPPETAEKVDKGTFAGDVFPHGMYVCAVDETNIEMHGEVIADKWVKIIFGMRPSHTDGAGLQRIRPLVDMINDAVNLDFKVMMDDANPTTMLNRQYVSRLSSVGEYLLVDALKEGDTWDKVAKRLEGGSAHPALGMMAEKLQALMQYIAGTFSSFGGGASDIKAAGTATGVAAMAEEVAGRFLEAIKLMKQADINSRYIVLKNIQKRSLKPQVQKLIERFGKDVVDRFRKCSLKHTVKVTAKKGTDQPQSQALKIASLQVLGNLQAAVKDSPQAQDILSYASEEMNLPINIGIGLTHKRDAEYRISRLREATKQYSEKPLDDQTAAQIAIEIFTKVLLEVERGARVTGIVTAEKIKAAEAEAPLMPDGTPPPAPDAPADTIVMLQDHKVYLDVYDDFLQSEQARAANVVFRACVFLMRQLSADRLLLKQAELVKQQLRIQMMAKPPAPPAGPAPEDLKREQAEAEEKEVAMELGRRKLDEDAKDRELSRAEQAKDRDLERQIVLKEHENALDREKPDGAADNQKEEAFNVTD